jgi:hypothetical protein
MTVRLKKYRVAATSQIRVYINGNGMSGDPYFTEGANGVAKLSINFQDPFMVKTITKRVEEALEDQFAYELKKVTFRDLLSEADW